MKQTVVGVFETYADACGAQQALADAGLQPTDIAVYTKANARSARPGPRVYEAGADATHQETQAYVELEHLFARLFKPDEYPAETVHYREVIRRGGTLVSIDVPASDVTLAQNLMSRLGAVDIEECAATWKSGDPQSDIFGSPVRARPDDEASAAGSAATQQPLGGSPGNGADQGQQSRGFAGAVSSPASPPLGGYGVGSVDTMRETAGMSTGQRMSTTLPPVPQDSPAEIRSYGARVFIGKNEAVPAAVVTPSTLGESNFASRSSLGARGDATGATAAPSRRDTDAAGATSAPGGQRNDPVPGLKLDEDAGATEAGYMSESPERMPLDYGEYDEDFRRDYDSRYANEGAPYEDYRRAYQHGATAGRDEQARAQNWPDVEDQVRQRWETSYPESGWERFKAAVRHGWERVTGH